MWIIDIVQDSSLMLKMWNISEKVMIFAGSLLTQDIVWFLVRYRKFKRKLWRAECFCSWHGLLSKKIITTLKTNREKEFKHVVPDMNHRKSKSRYLCKYKITKEYKIVQRSIIIKTLQNDLIPNQVTLTVSCHTSLKASSIYIIVYKDKVPFAVSSASPVLALEWVMYSKEMLYNASSFLWLNTCNGELDSVVLYNTEVWMRIKRLTRSPRHYCSEIHKDKLMFVIPYFVSENICKNWMCHIFSHVLLIMVPFINNYLNFFC